MGQKLAPGDVRNEDERGCFQTIVHWGYSYLRLDLLDFHYQFGVDPSISGW